MIGEAHPALPGLETSVLKLPLWRLILYALVIVTGISVAMPTFLPRDQTQSWPTAPVSLGLDLRGGASLTLRADEAAIRAGLVSEFAAALAEAEPSLAVSAREDGSGLIITVPDSINPNVALSVVRSATPEVGGGPLQKAEPAFSLAMGEDTVVATLLPAAVALVPGDAVARSIEVIRNRIDEAGVAEPSIQSMGRDRILVQMPGIDEPAGLRALLGATAELTFHKIIATATEGALTLPEAEGVEITVVARPALDGEHLADASAAFDPETGAPVVDLHRRDSPANLGEWRSRAAADSTMFPQGSPPRP